MEQGLAFRKREAVLCVKTHTPTVQAMPSLPRPSGKVSGRDAFDYSNGYMRHETRVCHGAAPASCATGLSTAPRWPTAPADGYLWQKFEMTPCPLLVFLFRA